MFSGFGKFMGWNAMKGMGSSLWNAGRNIGTPSIAGAQMRSFGKSLANWGTGGLASNISRNLTMGQIAGGLGRGAARLGAAGAVGAGAYYGANWGLNRYRSRR